MRPRRHPLAQGCPSRSLRHGGGRAARRRSPPQPPPRPRRPRSGRPSPPAEGRVRAQAGRLSRRRRERRKVLGASDRRRLRRRSFAPTALRRSRHGSGGGARRARTLPSAGGRTVPDSLTQTRIPGDNLEARRIACCGPGSVGVRPFPHDFDYRHTALLVGSIAPQSVVLQEPAQPGPAGSSQNRGSHDPTVASAQSESTIPHPQSQEPSP